MDLWELIKSSLNTFIIETTALEWLGVVTGTLCVWFAAKNIIWNWPLAIISVICYIFIFHDSKLYADMGLQVYFLGMNIYGWYYWNKNKNASISLVKIRSISRIELLWASLAVVLITYLLGTFLYQKTDAHFPFVDSFCAASSLVAQFFLARRIKENWLIWILVDLIYIVVYFSKDLYATGLMYCLYIFIAIVGYLDWKKIYHQQLNNLNNVS